MTKAQLRKLRRGDLVRNASGKSYVIIDHVNGQPVAVRTVTVTNPSEWELVVNAYRRLPESPAEIRFLVTLKPIPGPWTERTFASQIHVALDDYATDITVEREPREEDHLR